MGSKSKSKQSKASKKDTSKKQNGKTEKKPVEDVKEAKGIENKLFGSILEDNSKIDSTISSLFGGAGAGPVSRPIKERTYLESVQHESEDEEMQDKEEEEESKDENSSQTESAGEEEEEVRVDAKGIKKSKKRSTKSNDEDDDLEANYMERLLDNTKEESEDEKEESDNKESKGDEEENKEDEEPQTKEAKEAKAIDLKEAELEKAERTLFVGNLAASVMSSKKQTKELKKKFSDFGKVESIRFRSIAFSEQVPKKVAYIQKKFHDFKDTVNAYVVFENKESVHKAVKLNGEVFLDHHLRVDSVSHPFKKDNNRSIFIGNLDFTEIEESLWKFFEPCGKIEYVRVIRDPKTNIGKGFAYIQFEEPMSVSKALLLNGKPLQVGSQATDSEGKKKKPRTLRVTRCKKSNNDKKALIDARSLRGSRFTEKQKTKLGRAKTILGSKDKQEAGKFIIEGSRAEEGKGVSMKNGKIRKPRIKKPRYTERSKRFKNLKEEVEKKGTK